MVEEKSERILKLGDITISYTMDIRFISKKIKQI